MRPFVYKNSVHKYRAQPKEKVRDVIEIVKRLLRSLGYLKADGLMDAACPDARRARIRLARAQQARTGQNDREQSNNAERADVIGIESQR